MVLKFKDAVVNSYQHFYEDLGVVPTIDDIFSDLVNYEVEEDMERLDEIFMDIKEILERNELEYRT